MFVDLAVGALMDMTSDASADLPVLETTGPRAALTLIAPAGAAFGMAPGRYVATFDARPIRGEIAGPVLACLSADGRSTEIVFAPVSATRWRAEFTLREAVASLRLRIPSHACAFVFVGLRIEDGAEDATSAPTLRDAARIAARALFRMTPQGVRNMLLSDGRRARWLMGLRDGAGAPATSEAASGAGRISLSAQSDPALRADFENRFAVARGVRAEDYVSEDAASAPGETDVKLIAFYLPQFHPIPENDSWWGKGFTEWTNVAKAVPQFAGHYQPRLPGELGFYDLRAPNVMAQQAALARRYGVSAFCFHYYWFAGKRLLEAPLDAFAADKTITQDFCLCWANENWTRKWDGAANSVLIAQQHSPDDHRAVFDDLARYMEDPRYLRVDGRPVLMVYRPAIIPEVREMTRIWRERAAARGWPGLYLIASNAFQFDEWRAAGFDALGEFPPHGLQNKRIERDLAWLNERHAGAVFDYGAVAERQARRLDGLRLGADETVFPGVMPGWDNEARVPGAGVIYHDATPEAYARWLSAAVKFARRTLPEDRRFVLINAWNEWAEGAHLEPDRRFGRAFLAATAAALGAPGQHVKKTTTQE